MNLKKLILMSTAIMLAGTIMLPVGGVHTAHAAASSHKNIKSQATNNNMAKDAAIQKILNELVKKGAPGVLLQTLDNGVKKQYTAGKANIKSGRSMQSDFHFRIGSITKTFVAVVALQLAGEGKLSLDDTVEKWLPGVVQGNGYDGNKITIRHLLQHTSGLGDYVWSEGFQEGFIENRFKTYKADELTKIGLKVKPVFAPGEKSHYSNTNTLLMGRIIQKVTGQTYAEQIQKRIIKPLGLKHTFLPGTSSKLPNPHARGYTKGNGSNNLQDITEMNPSWANAGGEMISTADDLQRFLSALLAGKLLKPKEMKQMFTTVKSELMPNYYAGLGVFEHKLSSNVSVWGHSGGLDGSTSYVIGTRDGKKMLALNVTENPTDPKLIKSYMETFDKLFAVHFLRTSK
ncbi:serine hydrolase domain-containing protein [Paenibacillus arenosi]|uniref:Beta-lactamase family protein n=1 Tax=Paenibacillus arenosi TaxID=2774142 RepID=A0ABR9B5P4_9BACL|nr:serine hydrolase domain-containing protein [Paenibacillus arenosi]MBD8500737.1 beta-lactamase family protein [Paenibacillus arenosi]